MYKAYIATKDKKAVMSFKGKATNDLLTLKEAQKLDEYAGVLDEDTILIDIDDYDHEGNLKNGIECSKILMDIVEDLGLICRVYKANRGYHFIFKNDKVKKCFTDTKLACGLVADIKVGCKNSYEVLKYKGKEREIIYDKFEDEEYDYLPKFLVPVKTTIDFLGMREGDGRNPSLYSYILTLQSNDFSQDECKKVLSIINQYIFKKPLSDKELNVIMRQDAFKKEVFYADKTFLFDKFARYLMSNAYIRRINGKLHIYKDGIYISGDIWLEREMIKNIPTLKDKDRKEVLKYLTLIVPDVQMSSAYLIAFKNGVYDLRDGSMHELSPEYIITNKIPFDYNPSSYSELADKTLDKLASHDKQTRLLLEEAIGYAFFRRNELRTSFWLIGDKRCGKSTFFQMLTYVVGEENRSVVDLPDLAANGFRAADIFGKLINICDDVDDDYIKKTGVLKKIVSGSEVQIEQKFKDAVTYKSYTKFYISANDYVRFNDKSGAMLDRTINIPFKNTFSKDDADFDPFIISKLMQPVVAEYQINIGLAAVKGVLARNAFTLPDCVIEEQQIIAKRNNPIILFFDELTLDEVLNHTNKDLYIKYDLWCNENGFQSNSIVEFGRKLTKYFNVTTAVKYVDKRTQRVYVKGQK